jgi:hypothetical protein
MGPVNLVLFFRVRILEAIARQCGRYQSGTAVVDEYKMM